MILKFARSFLNLKYVEKYQESPQLIECLESEFVPLEDVYIGMLNTFISTLSASNLFISIFNLLF